MSKAEKYLKSNKNDSTGFNKHFNERIETDKNHLKNREDEYLNKLNDKGNIKPHQQDIGSVLLMSQQVFWDIFDEIKNKKKPLTLLNPSKSFYVSVLLFIFGFLLLALSTIFS